MVLRSDELLELMEERCTCRAFKEDPIPDDCIQRILEVARWAPSGSNMQPWDILVVRDQERRAWLVDTLERIIKIDWENEKASGGAFPFGGLGYIINVPLIFIIVTDPRFSKISGQKSKTTR